ncbi:kinesin-like protein K39 [Haliotis rubra]|uniref:kinesin-like protein K39 n=1 Tax=Haliotis rubra TaxID=36100 RepID=UPI001EE5E8F3|nr:kinesin-like protein K39 [Haliotis rubra]XP_046551005.1 kinesin-like protein K39 [Haliotis rubra]
MDLSYVAVLQKNHTFLKENLQVDPVLDALYEKLIFTQADYDRCRQAGIEKCELVLETLKKKGVEGYKTLCAVLDTTQPFIKERLDRTSTEPGSPDLVYVNKGKLEAQYKKELAKKDGEIADLKSAIEGLEQQIEQNNIDHAELEERLKKESDEHMTEIEKKNGEIETLKTALSKSYDNLEQAQTNSEKVEKKRPRRDEEDEAAELADLCIADDDLNNNATTSEPSQKRPFRDDEEEAAELAALCIADGDWDDSATTSEPLRKRPLRDKEEEAAELAAPCTADGDCDESLPSTLKQQGEPSNESSHKKRQGSPL